MATSPVTRDNIYFYSSGKHGPDDRDKCFYVKVDTHLHHRASATVLYDLLTRVEQGPVLTKKGVPAKRQPATRKDEPPHFYTAQMCHYGLKPLKTRDPAKRALLAAFGGRKTLEVPQNILRLREDLRAEWIAANASAGMASQDAQIAAMPTQTIVKQQQAVGQNKDPAIFTSDDVNPEARAQSRTLKKTVVKGQAKSTGFKQAVTTKPPAKTKNSSGNKLSSLETLGRFNVSAPRLAEEWDSASGELLLKLSPSPRGRHLWGWFDFGVIQGVFRCGKPPTTIGGSCTFQWRGEDTNEGQMYFGEDNTGTLTFLGDGLVHGRISGPVVATTEFSCVQDKARTTNVIWQKSVPSWKQRFRGINSRSYAAAAAQRWGKWSADSHYTEQAAASDTTACGTPSDHEDSLWSSEGEDVETPAHSAVPEPSKIPVSGKVHAGGPSQANSTPAKQQQAPQRSRPRQMARRSPERLTEADLHGSFIVKAPALGEMWDSASGKLTIEFALSSTGRHLWGRFDFGIVSGVLRCTARPTMTSEVCTFTWRGRESGEGEMTFNKCNTGMVAFYFGGRIRGTIAGDLFESVEFTGVREPAVQVQAWKKEWREINERAWSVECTERWGGWKDGKTYREKPADSDTTDGGGPDSDNDDGDGDGEYDEPTYAF